MIQACCQNFSEMGPVIIQKLSMFKTSTRIGLQISLQEQNSAPFVNSIS